MIWRLLHWLGFHRWHRTSKIKRYCKICGEHQFCYLYIGLGVYERFWEKVDHDE